MEWLKNINLKTPQLLRLAGIVLVGLIVLAAAFSLLTSAANQFRSSSSKRALTADYYAPYAAEMGTTDNSGAYLSLRNIAVSSPAYQAPASGNSEDFEIKEYSAAIETRNLDRDCRQILDLKHRSDVVFENSRQGDKDCNYSFKVKRDSVPEILALINSLNPKELNESSYTIKKLVDDYSGEAEILQKKISSIEETLLRAATAYDEIAQLASEARDAESLARIIDSKIGIIERLTQERINVSAQLERLERAKSEQLDRLEYTYFNVSLTESKFVDREDLKSSWQAAIKSFVRDTNKVAQDISINLLLVVLLVFQYVVYFFIFFVAAKYGWRLAKYIWKK